MADGYGKVVLLLNTVIELCVIWLLSIPSLLLCHCISGNLVIENKSLG